MSLSILGANDSYTPTRALDFSPNHILTEIVREAWCKPFDRHAFDDDMNSTYLLELVFFGSA